MVHGLQRQRNPGHCHGHPRGRNWTRSAFDRGWVLFKRGERRGRQRGGFRRAAVDRPRERTVRAPRGPCHVGWWLWAGTVRGRLRVPGALRRHVLARPRCHQRHRRCHGGLRRRIRACALSGRLPHSGRRSRYRHALEVRRSVDQRRGRQRLTEQQGREHPRSPRRRQRHKAVHRRRLRRLRRLRGAGPRVLGRRDSRAWRIACIRGRREPGHCAGLRAARTAAGPPRGVVSSRPVPGWSHDLAR